ncbi:MAG TPA: hypothetical protein ENI97_13970 [Gammaproteobacteria bacterium]|nr:hypothetical protein [Gammaproteobacteria bacterium]
MDISGVSIPAVPEVQTEPPRDAQLASAVPEANRGESAQNNPQADAGGSQERRDTTSNIGRNIDERA